MSRWLLIKSPTIGYGRFYLPFYDGAPGVRALMWPERKYKRNEKMHHNHHPCNPAIAERKHKNHDIFTETMRICRRSGYVTPSGAVVQLPATDEVLKASVFYQNRAATLNPSGRCSDRLSGLRHCDRKEERKRCGGHRVALPPDFRQTASCLYCPVSLLSRLFFAF